MSEFTSVTITHRMMPASDFPWRVALEGDPVWATNSRGDRLYVESRARKHIAACTTVAAANAAAERASKRYGLPYTPWRGE